MQISAQFPIHLSDGGDVAIPRQHLHQRPIVGFTERIRGDYSAQIPGRVPRIPIRDRLPRKYLQCCQELLLSKLSILEHPWLAAPFQEWTGVQLNGLHSRLGVPTSYRKIKRRYVGSCT